VAFDSYATVLVPGDTNQAWDVFVRDRLTGVTERVSVSSTGTQGYSDSRDPSISADGRRVAFWSWSTNLVQPPAHTRSVFVRDRVAGTTELASVTYTGSPAGGQSLYPAISADGRFVAFGSGGAGMIPGGTNAWTHAYVRDLQNQTTELVSVASNGMQANHDAYNTTISGDGRFVAFVSKATNLAPGVSNGILHVYVRDRQSGTTEIADVNAGGLPANAWSMDPSFSADGRLLAFSTNATNLGGVPNHVNQIYVLDLRFGLLSRESVNAAGALGNGHSLRPSLSADGRFVVFHSSASNLTPGDTNGRQDVFCRDRQTGRIDRMSVDAMAAQGNGDSTQGSLSGDARYVVFASVATDLVPGDSNGFEDVFLHERTATGVSNLCDPGVSRVHGCPCSNPAIGGERGCDNSAGTGGARLAAFGETSLNLDDLVFTTSGQPPNGMSIVLQGNALLSSGTVFGQGVRCAGGALKRLYVKVAQGGSITAPDSLDGEVPISQRSATLGDPIGAGERRWYVVSYRDPVVLGGCPRSATFNATQTAQVGWQP
jgi:Tol biopolymer transport system component